MKIVKSSLGFVLISILSFVMISCEGEDELIENVSNVSEESSLKCSTFPKPNYYVINHDGTTTIDGPEYYFVPATGGGQIINREIYIENHEKFKEKYILFVKNGHGDGGGMVSFWEIRINGAVIYGSNDVLNTTIFSSEDVELPDTFNLEVELEGTPESYIKITIYGELKENYFCKDKDGTIYKTVKIGDQIWMAENLRSKKLNNGADIQIVENMEEWNTLATPGYSWYENNYDKYGITYGALYNWYAVSTGKLCPIGWHVPSMDEFTALITYLGGVYVAGGKLKESGTEHWIEPNIGATNESGFMALPSNMRGYPFGTAAFWWSATPISFGAWSLYIQNKGEGAYQSFNVKNKGLSVRCVKD